MKKLIVCLFSVLIFSFSALTQEVKKVLFLGNSYTYGNDLPKMVADIAASMGDSLVYDENTVGGYQLWQHEQNTTSLNKIGSNNWDYVVLQEQSYVGTIAWARDNFSYPAIRNLRSEILKNDSCSDALLFLTWGRENAFQGQVGDGNGNTYYTAAYQDYFQMQDSLDAFYLNIANQDSIPVSPVGAVWRKMRTYYPNYPVYTSDGSHPNVSGTYIAACTFYASIFEKSPTSSSFLPNGVDGAMAENIKAFVDTVVVQNLSNWHIGSSAVASMFTADTVGFTVEFTNLSQNATSYFWDFGDGNSSTDKNPIHVYSTDTNYTVTLTSYALCDTASFSLTININDTTNNNPGTSITEYDVHHKTVIYPIPASSTLHVLNGSTNFSYHIYSISGQLIDSGVITNKDHPIDISALNTGVYLIEIISPNQEPQQFRFIKKE